MSTSRNVMRAALFYGRYRAVIRWGYLYRTAVRYDVVSAYGRFYNDHVYPSVFDGYGGLTNTLVPVL